MHPTLPITLIFSDTETDDNLDYSKISDEACMQRLVAHMAGKDYFQDPSGSFFDVCQWHGVQCDVFDNVKKIKWGRPTGLHVSSDGRIEERIRSVSLLAAGGSINLIWVPPKATELHVNELALQGTLNTAGLPRTLRKFSCVRNQIHGLCNTLAFPPFIISMEISENQITGSLCLSTLPDMLFVMLAAHNVLSGALDFTALPQRLKWIDVSYNSFSGQISFEHLSVAIERIVVHGNQLSQKVLYIGKLGKRFESIRINNHSCDFIQNNSRKEIVCRKSASESNAVQLEILRENGKRVKLVEECVSMDSLQELSD